MSKLRIPNRRGQLIAPQPVTGMRTLWRAKLSVSQEFLFREKDEWELAAKTAQDLVDSSASCAVSGATIVAVERVATLWN